MNTNIESLSNDGDRIEDDELNRLVFDPNYNGNGLGLELANENEVCENVDDALTHVGGFKLHQVIACIVFFAFRGLGSFNLYAMSFYQL